MPITALSWALNQGYDIHILRNNEASRRLDDTIFVVEELHARRDPDNNPKKEFRIPRGITPQTAPEGYAGVFFMPNWALQGTQNNTTFEFNGIEINSVTGEITARPHAAPRLTSFMVQAVLQINTAEGIQEFKDKPTIIVHVHDQITNAWVTPSTLNARPDVVEGIAHLELKLLGNKAVEKIVWGSDDTFSHPIDRFLINDMNPFNLTAYPAGKVFDLFASVLFDNRRHFPENEVFKSPVQLEIKYAGQAEPVRMAIPTHLSHLLQTGQILNDGAGNDLFEVVRVEKPPRYRASVYATFDDGTMGDLTNNHGVIWSRGAGAGADDIVFDSDGAFEVTNTAVGKTLSITATLPARLARPGLNQAQGRVVVLSSWLNANPVARPLAGSPTHLSADEVPNVLFLSEGFDNPQDFERIALSVYNKLRSDTKATPWNHLFTHSMNAWALFQNSEETAASILYENSTFENAKLEDGNPADIALPLYDLLLLGNSRLDAGGLTLDGLIERVGLPIPADATETKSDKLDDWRQLADPNFGNGALTVSDTVFDFWKKLSARRLVEERNTVWGLCCGEKPKIQPAMQSNFIRFNFESRLQRVNVDLFLSRIRANSTSGEIIGERFWGRDNKGKFGKDYGLVIFLVGGVRSIGTKFSDTFFPEGQVNTGIGVGVVDDRVSLNFLGEKMNFTYPFFRWRQVPASPSFEAVPFVVPDAISIPAFGTVAHELSHSFNLDDEYATAGKLNIPPQIRLDTIYNLQRHDELLDGEKLSGEKIKWRWPRIGKAGVLAAAPVVNQNTIVVSLRAGHTAQFKVNDEVLLRHRDILGTPRETLSSAELKVMSKDETAHTLVLEPLSSTPFDWTIFGQGSLVFKPVKAPSEERNNPTGDIYAEVLSPLMRHRINESHRPQTKNFPCTEEDTGDQQNPVNLPSHLNEPDNHRRIIGLFSGGKGFSCGLYHPSGECIMRKESSPIFVRTAAGIELSAREVYQFCHVCRYSLVDQIDPTQHHSIDKDYAGIYPSKEHLAITILRITAIAAAIGALVGYGSYKLYESTKDDE